MKYLHIYIHIYIYIYIYITYTRRKQKESGRKQRCGQCFFHCPWQFRICGLAGLTWPKPAWNVVCGRTGRAIPMADRNQHRVQSQHRPESTASSIKKVSNIARKQLHNRDLCGTWSKSLLQNYVDGRRENARDGWHREVCLEKRLATAVGFAKVEWPAHLTRTCCAVPMLSAPEVVHAARRFIFCFLLLLPTITTQAQQSHHIQV